MMLVVLIAVLLAGGLCAWLAGAIRPAAARWLSLSTVAVDLVLALTLWGSAQGGLELMSPPEFGVEVRAAWMPRFGVQLHLGMDGLSLVMVVLTLVLGVFAVASSWTEIRERVGFHYFCVLWVLAGVLGVFVAVDLFLFYFFWELMLIPMYLLIGIWGHEQRTRAAIKFFLFTQASSLFMLVAIITLALVHYRASGELTFDLPALLGTPMSGALAFWLMLGFFVAFAVKLPMVPLHTWLPDAHTEAPTAGSLILAGLLLKTGAYGLLRFAVPLFPDASQAIAPVAMTFGVIGIIYGAALAYAQNDLKRLVAYTSVSHLGFVLLGIYTFRPLALDGVVLEMICHGLSTGGLFVLVGALQERLHTRDLTRMSGLWRIAPRFGALGLILALASLGLPGLGNFIAEFLIVAGTFATSMPLAALATFGLVLATVYSLVLVQRAFHGELRTPGPSGFRDLSRRELAVLGTMVVILLWLGLYPQPVLDRFTAAGQPGGPGVAHVSR